MFDRFKPWNVSAKIKASGWFSSPAGAEIVDMSDTGIGLRVYGEFKSGRKVRVVLVNGAPAKTVKINGVIRYAGAEAHGCHRIDVQFTDVSSKPRDILRRFRPA